jgi:hypothetical protein
MAEESSNGVAGGAPKTSWWSTLPGILTATTAVMKTPDGQLIEMKRMARFDVVDWNDQVGTVRITLNNGETVETRINACAMRGTNDLGEFRGDFGTIKSVVFVRQ